MDRRRRLGFSYFNSRPSARGDHALTEHEGLFFISIHAPPRGATIPNCATRTFAEYFNSRPSARGDVALAHVFHSRNISIHAPPRGATLRSALSSRAPSNFNSRPSARGDFGFGAQRIHRMLFQFTPLREGRLCDSLRASSKHSFQFTPLREGRRARRDRTQHRRQISIHAPPRGATASTRFLNSWGSNFNSRPSARGDYFGKSTRGFPPYFNSRPSARGDADMIEDGLMPDISIHAPPRGATEWGIVCGKYSDISIHAPPRGATKSRTATSFQREFQFTPLREGRHINEDAEKSLIDFNSRPSARGDSRKRYRSAPRSISIHAPPRGATPQIISVEADKTFQFTPLREGRQQKICNFCKSFVQPLQISMA